MCLLLLIDNPLNRTLAEKRGGFSNGNDGTYNMGSIGTCACNFLFITSVGKIKNEFHHHKNT